MIAENNPVLSEACESLFLLNVDDIARQRSLAREDNIALENALNQLIADQAAEIENQAMEITSLSSENKTLFSEKEALCSENERLRAELAKYQSPDGAK